MLLFFVSGACLKNSLPVKKRSANIKNEMFGARNISDLRFESFLELSMEMHNKK